MNCVILTLMIGLISSANCEIYSVNSQFQVSPQVTAQEIGHIRYESDYHKDGWNKLYIYASPHASPLQQH